MKTGTTNEELMARYYAGEDTRLELYNRIRKLIAQIAHRVAMRYYCVQFKERTGTRTAYTRQILEDLRDEGMLEFFRVIDLRKYDPAQGQFTTYIHPFLEGAMRRWMETNLGSISVTKDEMERIRAVQHAYHSDGKSIAEIAAERNMSPEAVERDIGYNTHLLPLSELTVGQDENEISGDPLDFLLVEDDVRAVDTEVYEKICVELLEELFHVLSYKDQYILGSSFGVFGFEEKIDDEIAFELEMSNEGLRRAKKAALGRLIDMIPGSRLEEWRLVHRVVLEESRRSCDPDAFEDEEYDDRPKIFIPW